MTNHLHVLLWAATLGLLVAAAALVLRRERWQRALAGFVTAAVVFQVLTLGQPPVALGALLAAAVCAVLWLPLAGHRLGTPHPGARRWAPTSAAAPRTS